MTGCILRLHSPRMGQNSLLLPLREEISIYGLWKISCPALKPKNKLIHNTPVVLPEGGSPGVLFLPVRWFQAVRPVFPDQSAQSEIFLFSALQHPIPKFNQIKRYRANFKKVAENRYKKIHLSPKSYHKTAVGRI